MFEFEFDELDVHDSQTGPATIEIEEHDVVEDVLDMQDDLKSEAAKALKEGNLELGLQKLTEAIQLGPTALLLGRRASVQLELEQLPAAIEDCGAALALNPNCGMAHKVRGRAFARQDMWEAAHVDFCAGLAIDHDGSTAKLARSVAEKAKVIREKRAGLRLMTDNTEEHETSDGRAVPLRRCTKPRDAPHVISIDLPWAEKQGNIPWACCVVEGVLCPKEADILRAWVEHHVDSEVPQQWQENMGHLHAGFYASTLTHELWARLEPFVPVFHGKDALGLSEHLRFLKYGPGHCFPPHKDSFHIETEDDGSWAQSICSVILYLSDPEEGTMRGSTRFIAPNCPACATKNRCDADCAYCVDAPVRKGSVLLFNHEILHAGTEPERLEKFVMRTDLLYRFA